jgi:hypothetical protein
MPTKISLGTVQIKTRGTGVNNGPTASVRKRRRCATVQYVIKLFPVGLPLLSGHRIQRRKVVRLEGLGRSAVRSPLTHPPAHTHAESERISV